MRSDFDTLLCETPCEHVLRITLNRSATANALNTQMGLDLYEVFDAIIFAPQSYRCIVLTGAGETAFCAGGDLKERNGMTDEAWRKQHIIFEKAIYAIMDCPVPVVAAVNGAAYGGGAEIALAADFIHASASARFGMTEAKLGIIPGGGGTQTLARAVGTRRAKELIFSAVPFSAAEAERWGMINKVWPDNEALKDGAFALAKRIAQNAPISVRQAKRAISVGSETDLKTGLAIEIEAYHRTVPTQDRREGVAAFNEKRTPKFEDL